MKTVFLVIPHYVFSSDLLHTKYIKYLSEKYRVIVFSPVFRSNPPENYYQSPNIEYIAWTEENPRFWLFFTKTLRISMIREFDNLEYFKLRRLMKINLNWQRKFLRMIGWFLPRQLLTADFFTKLEGWVLPKKNKFQEYLKKYKPSLVLTCTPGFNSVEAEIIIIAKKYGRKTVAIDSSWDNYTSNATQFRKTDYLICWNEVMKKEAMNIHHYSENKVFVSGVYRFDHHFEPQFKDITKEEFLRSKNLDPKLKTLFLSTVPPNTYPPQYKVWHEIVKMQQEKQLAEDVNILIRLHPNDIMEKYTEFNNIKNLHLESPGKLVAPTVSTSHKTEMDEADLKNLRYSLKYTDININFRSSLSLEATIYNKPIINLALDNYSLHYQMDHYIPILKNGGTKLVRDDTDLKNAINSYLINPDLDAAERKKIFDDYIKFTDGLSYRRSVDALLKMI